MSPGPRLSARVLLALLTTGCALDVGGASVAVRGGRRPQQIDAGPPEGTTGECCWSRDLGALPRELRNLRWPALPVVQSELDVSTDGALRDALATRSNVRLRVHGAHAGLYTVERSDVELVLDPDASIEHVLVARSQHRVRIAGGTLATIEMMPPIDFPNGGTVAQESLMATDLTVECVTMRAPDTAFLVRGHRVAILGADVEAERYSLFAGDTAPVRMQDLIVAHSVLRSAGPEATYRVADVVRSVLAFSTLSNTFKHNYRVHGVSELNYLGDSILIGTGIMLGRLPGDALTRPFVVRDTIYYDSTNGIFLTDPSIDRLTATDDVAYSASPFVPSELGRHWTIRNNTTRPYEAPPSSAYECR